MRALIVTCCIAAFAAPLAVSHLQARLGAPVAQEAMPQPAGKTSAKTEPQSSPLRPVYQTSAGSGRREIIAAGRNGHFKPQAKLNRVAIPVLVDTGASSVALNKSTARKLGLRSSQLQFDVQVSTANGNVMAAHAKLDTVSIGKITVRDVQALVLDDDALDTVLLGNSFLSRLRSYRVSDGRLILQN
ncbi:MAG: TIGR02281 family clan AA aspartic protease [Pseudomonadota bacterium]